MAKKLNQVIAIEKGAKAKARDALTEAHHAVQRTTQLSGLTRTYQPLDDENGEHLPAEATLVQVKATEAIVTVRDALVDLFDVVATKEWANGQATADVTVGDRVVLAAVPVTYVLFLEKQLVDLHTFVGKLPVLDPAQEWTHNAAAGTFSAKPVETTRTKKVPRNHVKAEATEKHPAQVEVYYEDVIVGRWTKTEFSGALEADTVAAMLDRVEKLQRAVKEAREEANGAEVTDQQAGAAVLDFVFGTA